MRLPVFFMWTPQRTPEESQAATPNELDLASRGALQASQPEGNDGQPVPLALLMRDGRTHPGPLQLPPFRRTHVPNTNLTQLPGWSATTVSQPQQRAIKLSLPLGLGQYTSPLITPPVTDTSA